MGEEEVVNTPTTPEQNMALEWYHHQVNEIFQKLTPSKNQQENLKQENLIQQEEEEEEEEDKQASFSEIESDQKEMHVPTTETEDTLNNNNNTNNDAVSISSSTSDLEPTALMNQMLCEGVDVIDSFDRQLYSNNGFFPNVELQSETVAATPISKSMASSEHGVVAPLHWSAKKTPGKFGKVYWANEMTGETHYDPSPPSKEYLKNLKIEMNIEKEKVQCQEMEKKVKLQLEEAAVEKEWQLRLERERLAVKESNRRKDEHHKKFQSFVPEWKIRLNKRKKDKKEKKKEKEELQELKMK